MVHQLKHQEYRDALGIHNNEIESVTISNTMGSGKIHYRNAQNKQQNFQIGTHIIRENHKHRNSFQYYSRQLSYYWNKWQTDNTFVNDPHLTQQNIRDYYEQLDSIYEKYSHLFQTINDNVIYNRYLDHQKQFVSNYMHWAINFVINNKSEIAIHLDPLSQLPCLLTMDNPLGDYRPFTGGELLLNEYAWVADYGPKDVILFRGDKTWHMVLPTQGKPIKHKPHVRASQIFFSNMPDNTKHMYTEKRKLI